MENKKDRLLSWQETVQKISADVKDAVIAEARRRDGDKIFASLETTANEIPALTDANMLDLCLEVKSVLAMINYGDVQPSDKDKEFVRRGILALTAYYADDACYNMLGQLRPEYCAETFGDADAYIHRTMATVFLTFVYFRRAVKRLHLFTDMPLVDDALTARIAGIMRRIIRVWLAAAEQNDYRGWGFMSDSTDTNLADTYRVVEAISKYQDACDKDAERQDAEFVNLVDAGENLTDKIESAMYKVALHVYDETAKECYGEGIFYKTAGDDGRPGMYRKSDMEQVLGSNRSSALFQPLYVAMITMLGYTDKEVIIRKFMTSPQDTQSCVSGILTNLTEDGRVENAAALREVYAALTRITVEHPPVAELSEEEWQAYYDEARLLEKAIEEYAASEMSRNIREYRSYLNKTKDAIDNVQVFYRKFNDSQKLGIVDTDYAIFSKADVRGADAVALSRLNKSNIVTAYIKPLLLSAKIMIVNALTKYPQADMETLYNDIMDSVYRKRNKARVMLWNEEEIDMFATACNCDSIAYDYFDYYTRYELNYRTMTKIYNETQKYITGNFVPGTEGADFAEAAAAVKKEVGNAPQSDEIVDILFDAMQEQIKALKSSYDDKLREKEKEHQKDLEETKKDARKDLEQKQRDYETLQQAKDAQEEKARRKEEELIKESEIAAVIKKLIDRKISEAFENAMGLVAVLNMSGANNAVKNSVLEATPDSLARYPHSVRSVIERMHADTETMENDDKKAYFDAKTAEARALRDMFDMAFGNVMRLAARNYNVKDEANDLFTLYEAFGKEKLAFERNWMDATVRKHKDDPKANPSLQHLFSALEKQPDIFILSAVKPEAKETKKENEQ